MRESLACVVENVAVAAVAVVVVVVADDDDDDVVVVEGAVDDVASHGASGWPSLSYRAGLRLLQAATTEYTRHQRTRLW